MLKIRHAYLICFLFVTSSVAQTKLACVGNSLTQGYNAPSYTEKLKTLLGSKYTVLNAGVSGCTLLKKGDKPYWTQGKLNEVIAFKPDIVTIMLGTNDTKDTNWSRYSTDFKKDYTALIDTIQKLQSTPEVWIVLPCPCWSNQYAIRDSIISIIIPILREIASQYNLQVIDANTPFKNAMRYFTDGVHPNASGADSLAIVFYKALTSVTGIDRNNNMQYASSKSQPSQVQIFFNVTTGRNNNSFKQYSNSSSLFDLRGAVSHPQGVKGQKVFLYSNQEK